MLAENTHDKYRKNRKNNYKCNNIQDFEKEEAKKGPEMSAKIAKVTRIFLRAKNTRDKYRKKIAKMTIEQNSRLRKVRSQ